MAPVEAYIQDAYIEWYQTQTEDIDYTKPHANLIREVKELHARRAPGNTCLQALHDLSQNREVHNNSKGCGGVMRIAPIPLRLLGYSEQNEWVRAAGEAARITHKHPLGYLPAALLAYLIGRLVGCQQPTSRQIAQIIHEGVAQLRTVYPEQGQHIDYLKHLVEKAGRCAMSCLSDAEAIRQIGEGWVAEETLAIAVFCVMRYPDNFEKAIIASVNHSGDSDSTGAVTGNIMGAICGYDAIPSYYKEHLELRWLVEEMADDTAADIPVSEYSSNDTEEARRWIHKYIDVWSVDTVPVKNSFVVDRDLRIYAGEYPGAKNPEECRRKVRGSNWSGYCHFYDLTEEGELTPYSCYLEEQQHHHRFPMADCGVPSNTASVRGLIEEIIARSKQWDEYYGHRGKTYIHGWGGVGRTGTVVACLYAYQMKGDGLSADIIYERAMQRLFDGFHKCPKSKYRAMPDTQEQCQFVRAFVEQECAQQR